MRWPVRRLDVALLVAGVIVLAATALPARRGVYGWEAALFHSMGVAVASLVNLLILRPAEVPAPQPERGCSSSSATQMEIVAHRLAGGRRYLAHARGAARVGRDQLVCPGPESRDGELAARVGLG